MRRRALSTSGNGRGRGPIATLPRRVPPFAVPCPSCSRQAPSPGPARGGMPPLNRDTAISMAETGWGRHCCRPRCRPLSRPRRSASSVSERSRTRRGVAAVMRHRAPQSAFRTRGYCCIVMLVASSPIDRGGYWGPTVRSLHLFALGGLSGLGPFRPAKLRPAMEAGDGSRQAVGRAPKSRSVRLAVPAFRCIPPAWASRRDGSQGEGFATVPSGVVVRLAEARPSVAPSGPRRLGQRLRATRCICGSPGSIRRSREACFPTLLRASLPLHQD